MLSIPLRGCEGRNPHCPLRSLFIYLKSQASEKSRREKSFSLVSFIICLCSRGRTSPDYSRPSQARALNVEPEGASSLSKLGIEPTSSPLIIKFSLCGVQLMLNFGLRAWVRAQKKARPSFLKIGLGQPGFCLILCEPNFWDRAFEPEPRLVPPLYVAFKATLKVRLVFENSF